MQTCVRRPGDIVASSSQEALLQHAISESPTSASSWHCNRQRGTTCCRERSLHEIEIHQHNVRHDVFDVCHSSEPRRLGRAAERNIKAARASSGSDVEHCSTTSPMKASRSRRISETNSASTDADCGLPQPKASKTAHILSSREKVGRLDNLAPLTRLIMQSVRYKHLSSNMLYSNMTECQILENVPPETLVSRRSGAVLQRHAVSASLACGLCLRTYT